MKTHEDFKCEVCGCACIREKGSTVVTERRCFAHASREEQDRRGAWLIRRAVA